MALWSFCDFDFPLGSVTVRTTKDLSCLPCRLVFLVVMCSSLISCFISVSSSLICCSSVLTSSENCELCLGLYWHQNGIKTVYFKTLQIAQTLHVFHLSLLGFSIRYCLRMRMVEFCQESTSLLTVAVSCLLLANCSFRVSNSCRLVASCFFRVSNSCWLTHCHDACGEI